MVIIRSARIIPTINFLFTTVYFSMKVIYVVVAFIILTLLSFSIVANQIWGYRFSGFKDVVSSFINVIMIFELNTVTQPQQYYLSKTDKSTQSFTNLTILLIFLLIIMLYISNGVVFGAFNINKIYFDRSEQLRRKDKHEHY